MKNFKNLLFVIIVFLQFSTFASAQINNREDDLIPPVAIVYSGTAQIILPAVGYVVLPAVYFNQNSYDNVTAIENLKYSFSPDINENFKAFCEGGIQDVTIYVWDEAGNFATAVGTLNIIGDWDFEPCCECYTDKTPPVAICGQNVELQIGSEGSTQYLYARNLVTESYDNETGVGYFPQFINQEIIINYGCDQLGVNTLDVIVFDFAGNSDTCTSSILVTDPNDYCSALSKSKIDNSTSISFQPNPANTEVVIQNADQFKFIHIMNTNGVVIRKYEQLSRDFIINSSLLPNGIYFIQGVNDKKLTVSKKLVVSH